MRQRIITIAVGLAAGAAGALVMRHGPAAAPAPAGEPPTAPIVPPGWDRRTVARLAALEDRVRGLGAPSREPAPVSSGTDRAQSKLSHYEQELAVQRDRIEGHHAEPLDAAWSRATTDQLRGTFTAMLARREILDERVDCRSKTCVATLTFPTPGDALAFLASPALRVLGRDLHGLSSTPTPPSSAGAYDLTVVLDR